MNDPGARPEILFLRRESYAADDASLINNRPRNTKEAHVAFPGGRTEEGDEGGLYTGASLDTLSPSSGVIILLTSHATNLGGNRP